MREIKYVGGLRLVGLRDEGEYLVLEGLYRVNEYGRQSHVEDITSFMSHLRERRVKWMFRMGLCFRFKEWSVQSILETPFRHRSS